MPTFERAEMEATVRFSVLVVEPDAAIGRLLAAMLELQGHRIHLASSAAEALRICADRKTPLEIVLIDSDRSGMCRSNLARECLVDHPGVRLLTMGVGTEPASTDWAGIPSSRGHLQTPFDLNGLAALIRACGVPGNDSTAHDEDLPRATVEGERDSVRR